MHPISASSDLVARSVSRYLQRRLAIRSGLLAGATSRATANWSWPLDAELAAQSMETPPPLPQSAAGPSMLVEHVNHQPTL